MQFAIIETALLAGVVSTVGFASVVSYGRNAGVVTSSKCKSIDHVHGFLNHLFEKVDTLDK